MTPNNIDVSMVPYTLVLQDIMTGDVSSMLLDAPASATLAKLYVAAMYRGNCDVVALVRGKHLVIPAMPGRITIPEV